jgi:hypothetical protein
LLLNAVGIRNPTAFFARDSFQVDASSFVPAIPFTPSASMTKAGGGPYASLGNFVPPFLSRGSPNFFFTAFLTRERHIFVVAAQHKVCNAVTIIGREFARIHNRAARSFTF